MDSQQLTAAALSDKETKKYTFLGVFSPDTIPVRATLIEPYVFISNTDDSHLPGSHWIAIHKDETGRGFYFDSYGVPPKLPEFVAVLDSCFDWSFNKQPLQSLGSTACGQYCLFFITHAVRGFQPLEIAELLNQDDDRFVNDAIVNKFVEENFDLDLPITDYAFVLKQVAKQLIESE